MKKARCVSAALLGLLILAIAAKADPSDSSSDNNPSTQYDADGVPVSVTQPQPIHLSPEDTAAIRKEQEQSARDKNWLLRGYEQQLQNSAANSSQDQSANLYYQLSSNKDLARLAGLPALDLDNGDGTLSHQTGADHAGPSAAALRADAPSATRSGALSFNNHLGPLITPLSAADAAGLHNFYSPLPVAAVSSFYGSLPEKSAMPASTQSEDHLDIETPGMIASEKNPPGDTSTLDLTLDLLPGESSEQARAHQDNNNSLQLPLAMDADQLHKKQAAAMSVPGLPNAAQTAKAAPPPAKAVPTEDPDAPVPVSQEPQINPVRAPIANPFDILDR
jgi:hypothetical protein